MTSYNSGACWDIWKNDAYYGQVNKHGYSCKPKIFRAMDAIGTFERKLAAKDKDTAAKKKIMGRTSGTKNVY